MRRPGPMLLGLGILSLVGCLTSSSGRPTNWLDRLSPKRAFASNVIPMDTAIIECPIGDGFLNQGVWEQADEQVVALDRKALLDDNGFRVGQFGEVMPARLQNLLGSNRTCAAKYRHQIHPGDPLTIALGPDRAQCAFEIHQDRQQVPVTLADAQCCFRIVASITRDGSTRLHVTPLIRHGARQTQLRATPAHDGVMVDEQRPAEDYKSLGWDMTLAANQFVIIGTRYDRSNTLGYNCFFRPDEARPVQRLLVIWPGRSPAVSTNSTASGIDTPHRGVPTIAEQAAGTVFRSQAP